MSWLKDVCHKMRSILLNGLLIAAAAAFTACSGSSSSTTAPTTTTTTTSTGGVPVVTAISPSSGPIEGGTSVTITGTGLTGATAVLFGSVNATTFSLISDTSIVATAPAGTAGATSDVTVVTAAGTSAIGTADLFQWGQNVITSFAPSATTVKSGTPVIVTVNFLYPLPAAVTLPITAVSSPAGSTAFQVPPKLTIPAASQTGALQVTTFFASTPQQLTLSTSYAGVGQSLAFTITP